MTDAGSAPEVVPGRRARRQQVLGWLAVWLPRLLLVGLAALHLGILYYIFWGRLGYPLDIEWMEGGTLMHAKRLLDGKALYGPPSLDFTSFCYTPLYPTLLAGLGQVFGLSYTLGRTVSIFAFTAVLFVIVRGARRAAAAAAGDLDAAPMRHLRRDALAGGIAAAGIIAGAFAFTGSWYDLVRNDSLLIGLLAGGFGLLATHADGDSAPLTPWWRRPWLRRVAGAGLLFGLAFLAKQTAAIFILLVGAAYLALAWRRVWVIVVVVGVVAGLGTLWIDAASDGWMWFYIFDLHQAHQTDWTLFWPKTPAKLVGFAPWVALGCLAAVAVWVLAAVVRRRLPQHAPLWFTAALAGIAAAGLGRATQWSHDNAYIPGVVFPAAFIAIASAEAAALFAARPGDADAPGWRGRLLARPGWLRAAAWLPLAACAIHLALVDRVVPARHVPDAPTWKAAQRLIAHLERLGKRGEVLVPYHPWYSVIAGGPGHFHIMSVNDVSFTRGRGRAGGRAAARRPGRPTERQRRVRRAREGLMRSIRAALSRGRFAALVHDRPLVGPYRAQLPGARRRFRQEWHLGWFGAAPRMLAGNPVRPNYVWVRPRPVRPPAGGRTVFDFEQARWSGWRVAGRAFGPGPARGRLYDPARRRRQGLISGIGGERLANSFHGGDAATGRLRSPPFALDRPVLSFLVGGGRDAKRLVVALLVDGRVVRRATGRRSGVLRREVWELGSLRGRQARLEITDESRGAWGHILVDEVWLTNRRPR